VTSQRNMDMTEEYTLELNLHAGGFHHRGNG
jgi:hypothetical protein